MKILIIANEEWNDYVFANGVLTNWFTDFDAEFAEIYTSPGLPINNICNRYFQITDNQMAKSIIGGPKAGRFVNRCMTQAEIECAKNNAQRQGFYGFMKRLSMRCHTLLIILRDLIWLLGRYDKQGLLRFVEEFNPDIVFCPRYITPKLMRLEKTIFTITPAPFVAFTGDSEVELTNFKIYTPSGIRRWIIHQKFTKHIKIYSHYLMHSADQAKEYCQEFGIKTSTFFKCGDFPDLYIAKPVGRPIRMIYAGRLYCNRWKSLAEIGRALQIINSDGESVIDSSITDFSRWSDADSEGIRYLTDENGNIIIGVRSSHGIHLMITQKSIYDFSEGGSEVSEPSLEEYYTTYVPTDENFPSYTSGDTSIQKSTYVNFIKTSEATEYNTRANEIKTAIKSFDPGYDYRLYEEFVASGKITFNKTDGIDLGEKIAAYINLISQ